MRKETGGPGPLRGEALAVVAVNLQHVHGRSAVAATTRRRPDHGGEPEVCVVVVLHHHRAVRVLRRGGDAGDAGHEEPDVELAPGNVGERRAGGCQFAARVRVGGVPARKRAVIYFGWVFFLISSGSPHVRPMGRTCGEPDEIGLTPHGGEIERLTTRTGGAPAHPVASPAS